MKKGFSQGILTAVLLFSIFFSGCGNQGESREALESSSGEVVSEKDESEELVKL